MSVWFEGSNEIDTTIGKVSDSFENLGEHYVDVVSLFPGMISVDLLDEGIDFVTIRTNEGLMKRTNISKKVEADRVIVELDEEYQVGKRVTVRSHFWHEFIDEESGVTHRLAISDVSTAGILGFLYRIFGRRSTGKAMLKSYKAFLEV